MPTKFYPDRRLLSWQRNLRQKGYNSNSVTDISRSLHLMGGLGDGLLNEANLIPPQLTLVAI